MDIICQAKSGMGKTAVFVLTTLHQIAPVDGEVHVLVLTHTRELAYQIQREYERFSKYLQDVKTRVFYGGVLYFLRTNNSFLISHIFCFAGVNIKQNVETLTNDKPHIIVGTPGRILDLSNRKHLDLSKVCRRCIPIECILDCI